MKIDHFGKWRSERVLTQLYAHLIGALLCHRLSAGWHWRQGQEYSLHKCVQIIQNRISDLMKCIAREWCENMAQETGSRFPKVWA